MSHLRTSPPRFLTWEQVLSLCGKCVTPLTPGLLRGRLAWCAFRQHSTMPQMSRRQLTRKCITCITSLACEPCDRSDNCCQYLICGICPDVSVCRGRTFRQ